MRLDLLVVFAIAAAAVIPQLASAHLLNGNKGPVDAFNYDEAIVGHLNEDCSQAFECRQTDVNGVFFFSCYYDVKSGECQCSKGDFSKCDASRSSLTPKEAASLQGRSNGVLGFVGAVAAKPFKLAYVKFAALPLPAKVVVLVIALAAVIFIFSRLRDNAANNLRKAKELHEHASELHEAGNEEEAKLIFEKSSYHREKAYEQMQQNPFTEKGLSKTEK
ncbi:hypothetical protein HYU40_02895 [Candidatus Woesearchaeota archaeon]|nr:hypothetical protein [Candidatus Woesearchaeota archaeon]